MTKIRTLALPALLALLAACNTIEGAGHDLQAAGQAVSTEANQAAAGM
ncbi:entericidin A/B family lipoprotein [Xinfangfangia pollutisoli]|nr:entericidin A/B family lipoprotein [Xinfangfangia pollutisoli]